jgi:N-methylhydantoinase B/oxoprolinase/acetone carboxylase alpha subunit
LSAHSYARDHDVVQRMRPEPITPLEQSSGDGITDLDFDIFKHKMHMIAIEGKETTMKLGASTAMRWGDVAFGIFTAQGDLAVCATGIYHHAVLGQIPIKYIVKHWVHEPSVGVREGDAYFYNDPFYAGVHNADMGLAIPVFKDGRLVCFVGAAVHTGECGGSDPGGMSPNARTKYDEGLLVPPIKIGENCALREDVLNMMAAMTRDPRTMVLDIKARLAAARTAERRILELIDRQGSDFFIGALRRILTFTGAAARRKISRLNDGVYRQPRFLDTVGTGPALTKVNLTLTKRGDRLILDLENSSPLVAGKPVNSYFQGIIGLAMVYLCGWLFHDLPANNGLLEALEWRIPQDSLVNAEGDTSTSMAPIVQVCFTVGMFLCGARLVYADTSTHAVAPWFSGFAVPIFGGVNQAGDPIADITPEVNASGAGARPDLDGVDSAGAFFATMSDCSDVEATEADRPFLYAFRNLFNGSYGHGRFRGGAGVGIGLMVHHVPTVGLGGFGAGARFPMTLGLFGGYAAPPTFVQYVQGSNLRQLMADGDAALPRNLGEVYADGNPEDGVRELHDIAMPVQPFSNGDTFYVPVGGGGGYGDVLERDPRAVLDDLRIDLTTHWAARNIYHVVYDETSLRVDEAATAAAREAVREGRIRRGRPYADFVAEWRERRPPAEVLRHYGSYPDPRDGLTEAHAAVAANP